MVLRLYREVSDFWGKIDFLEFFEPGPNRYRIVKTASGFRAAKIFFKRNHRTIEGIVHELLHLKFFSDRYPSFYCVNSEVNPKYVSQVNNSLQHQVMLPVFESLGFDIEMFESERPPFSEYEESILVRIVGLAPFSGIADYVSKAVKFFRQDGIEVRWGVFVDRGKGGVEWLDEGVSNVR